MVRLRLITFDISSEMEPCGEGDVGLSIGGLSKKGLDAMGGSSVSAVVGEALAVVTPDDPEEPGKGGILFAEEKRDEKDMRDARDPGRSGEGATGICGVAVPGFVVVAGWITFGAEAGVRGEGFKGDDRGGVDELRV